VPIWSLNLDAAVMWRMSESAKLVISMHTACLTHLILHDFITLIIFYDEYEPWSSSPNFLQAPIISSHLDPNILLSTLSSDNLYLCPYFHVRDQVSRPYRTWVKIKMLCILTLTSLVSGQKILNCMVASTSKLSLLALNFLASPIFIQHHSQIFEICHIFKGFF
jgi:hypothetical protein